jgi:hypothetical protein
MFDKLFDALKEFAAKLGQTIEYLWPHAVRYVVFDGLASLLTAVMVVFAVNWLRRSINATLVKARCEEYTPFSNCLGILAMCVAAAVGLACIPQIFEPVGYIVTKAITEVKK